MANQALGVLESALRARKLDRTLTTALPPLEWRDESALIPTSIAALDACLHGGLPRGQLSEIVGPRSSGRTTLLLQMMAAATQRGEIAAMVDTFDRLDVASAGAAGIDPDRLLWIRGQTICEHGPRLARRSRGEVGSYGGTVSVSPTFARCASAGKPWLGEGSLEQTVVDRALKALNLVLQAGGFAYVAIDLADVPRSALTRIPFTTWLRVQRIIEGSDTACVLVAPQPLARSAGGLTLSLTACARWAGEADRSRHVIGADLTVRIVSPRRRVDGEVSMSATVNH
jgi:recombination protein RecA